MRSAGVYLIEVEIGTIRNAVVPKGDIFITLRIGRSSNSTLFTNHSQSSEVNFNTVIQLNVDSSALDTQRCSISFNLSDRKMIGIALISLPKEKSFLQNTYRLTQNEDRRAEVDVKVRIAPVDVTGRSTLPLQPSEAILKSDLKQEDSPQNSDVVNKIHQATTKMDPTNPNSNPLNPENPGSKSKISQQRSYNSSDGRKTPKSFKVIDDDRIIQTSENELKRIREEKEAYYQLYQIEKSKSEAAGMFIANLIKKIAQLHPELLSVITQQTKSLQEPQGLPEKKPKVTQQSQQQQQNAAMNQLEQANRSLHRQIEEYKRLIDQLKGQKFNPTKAEVPLQSKASNTFLVPGLFDPPSKSNLKEKSSIKINSTMSMPQKTVKEERPAFDLADIDLKKWLNLSIGQREEIQGLLGTLAQKVPSKQVPTQNLKILKKLKANLDKSFTGLLGKKELTRQALMAHRREVNLCFEEATSSS